VIALHTYSIALRISACMLPFF